MRAAARAHGLFRPASSTPTLPRRRSCRSARRAGAAGGAAHCLCLASSRSFQFVPYGEELEVGDRKSICVDGLVKGSSLQLTHWTGNETPDEWYADTSTEIALNFVAGEVAAEAGWADALVVNNHYDTDGVASIFALVNPEAALRHRDMLIAAAEVGDFNEWPANEDGVKLDAALNAIAATAADDAEAYELTLARMPTLLDDLEGAADLWGDELREMHDAESALAEGELEVLPHPKVGALINKTKRPIPGPVLARIFGMPESYAIRRFLIATPMSDGRWRYSYSRVGHAWVARKVLRPAVPAPDVEAMLAAMGPEWSAEGGLTGLVACPGGTVRAPEDVLAQLSELDDSL